MVARKIRHLVVTERSDVVGVLSATDLGKRRSKGDAERTVAEFMSAHVVTASPNTTVREAANKLRGHVIGCLPIVEPSRGATPRLVGIITTTDLLELIGRGAERPIEESTRWTLKGRGPRTRSARLGN